MMKRLFIYPSCIAFAMASLTQAQSAAPYSKSAIDTAVSQPKFDNLECWIAISFALRVTTSSVENASTPKEVREDLLGLKAILQDHSMWYLGRFSLQAPASRSRAAVEATFRRMSEVPNGKVIDQARACSDAAKDQIIGDLQSLKNK